MYRTYQLKIKNTDKEYFSSLFRESKWYYNTILSSNDVFKFDTKSTTVTPALDFQTETVFLSSQMRQEIKKKIISSIKGLSKRKQKSKVGKLKFKSYVNSVNLKNQTFSFIKNKVRFQGNKKKYKIFGLPQLPEDSKIVSGILHRNSKGLYLLVTVEIQDKETNTPNLELGVDFGIKDSLTFSDGTKLNTNFCTDRLRKLQRDLSRKTKNSKNYRKAQSKYRKEHQLLENKKKDFTNKLKNKLGNYKIYFQDEMITSWKMRFGKQIHNGILGRVKLMLKQNTNNLMIPHSAPSTKLCPKCGVLNTLKLSDRVYNCECGYSKDRDIHAAQNMILIGSGRTYVEKKSDLFEVLKNIDCKHFSLKQ